MKTDLIQLLAKLQDARREMIHLMTVDRRGGATVLPYDAEAVKALGLAICKVSDRLDALEFGDFRTSEEAKRNVSLYR